MKRAVAGLFLLALGCSRAETEAPDPAPSSSAARRASLARFPLSAPVAFDLALRRDGAALVWSSKAGVSVLALDAAGARGATRTLDRGGARVHEVAAGGDGDAIGVAWLAVDGEDAEVRGTADEGGGYEVAGDLGRAELERGDRRGHLAVGAGRGGRLLAFHRGSRDSCHAGAAEACATFGMHELPPRGSQPSRPWLAVPAPCDEPVVGVALAAGRWHYALCALEGAQPVTTVFTAQPDPAYAQAQRVLVGCEPYGMSVLGEEVWVVGLCGGKRAAARLRGIEAAAPALDLSGLEVRCEGDTPWLRGGELRARLDRPVGRLAPLLPASIAPRGARAVWTGAALLVASAVAGELELARYRCLGGLLLRG